MNRHTSSPQQLAEKFSATALINSLLREWNGFEINNNEIVFRNEHKAISIVLDNYSKVGCHAFKNTFYRTTGIQKEIISFEVFVQELFRILTNDEQDAGMRALCSRIKESCQNLVDILKHRRSGYNALYRKQGLSFIDAEQALLLGHNVHPCPKSKSEFSRRDHRLYAPEFGNAFFLRWGLLKKSCFYQNHSKYFEDADWFSDLYKRDQKGTVDSEYLPFPFHPWQFETLKKSGKINHLINSGDLIPINKAGKLQWKATSSLRSIYCEDSDYMLKFSLSLRITNSIRHLQAAEVVRGVQVHEVMNSDNGRQFLAANKNFSIMNEPSFLAIKYAPKPVILETIVLIRENPFNKSAEQESIVLSTITQPNPYDGNGFLASRNIEAVKWFSLYLDNVLSPFIMAHANHGILFGAHQQNIIVQLIDGYPCGVIFRDCQGTGYTRLGYEKMKTEVSSLDLLNGNILDDSMTHALLGYYLVINSTFSLINALATQRACAEAELLDMLFQYLAETKKGKLLDASFVDYLLHSRTLRQKGNFYCSLKGVNENTEKNPLAIYNEIENPLYKFSKNVCHA
ncbi:IucA/IucC family protein [Nitrosomonas marina]|uniref:N2-citryl-N6-acetyl-N6-hydroxylysine synthase n=1 Tax=Nitrosomonas marina TaxID=917 RepID=A0A1H8B0V5_9PROT|nr:IucA/IucC family protein [Nitrosomonas marina]SEM76525.1 N2-citryl-N6-acetyl-N6-hydroxylysine synthase [Nitrosomonas marina]